ncbi:MAG: phospholipase D family protein [Pedobacter sp.]
MKPYLDAGKKFTIMAGANFGITDPTALEGLMGYGDNCRVYLSKLSSKIIFHPKIYLIRSKGVCHIIIGSANLTNGGTQANNECSIYHHCTTEDQIWKDASVYFKQCLYGENADYLTFPVLDAYIKYHKKQHPIITKSDPFPDVREHLFYDLKNLKKHYNQLDQNVIKYELKEKKQKYDQAKLILDEIASGPLSDARFTQQFKKLVINQGVDKPKLWSSSGMARQINRVLANKNLFRRLVLAVKSNLKQNPEVIYSYAKEVSDQLKGTGANYIGEIMLTYQYKRLPNLNNNPVTVLIKEAGARINAYPNTYKDKDYALYYSYISHIAKELGLKDMLEVDYFFDKVYQHKISTSRPASTSKKIWNSKKQ